MSTKKVVLGCTARDAVTGYQGIVIHKIEQLNGNVQFALQPKVNKDGEHPTGMSIDQHLLEFVDEGVMSRVTPVSNPSDIQLGNKVKDILSGFEGYATQKSTYLNGCEIFVVQPEIKKKDDIAKGVPDQHYIEAIRLKKIGDGYAKKITLPPPSTATNMRPGGPSVRVAAPVARR